MNNNSVKHKKVGIYSISLSYSIIIGPINICSQYKVCINKINSIKSYKNVTILVQIKNVKNMLNTQTICLLTMIFIKQSCVSENKLQNETAVNNLNVIKT
jgi:hypothetical protein